MANLIRDTFIRADQSGWGTASDSVAWSNANGNSSIVSNYGTITGTGATSTPTNYRSLSRQNNLKFTHKLNLGADIESGGVLFGGVKNTGSGNRDGVEWYISNGTTNNLGIYDNGTMKGQANFTFTTGTDYWVEMIVNTDYSCELRVWLTSDSRPTSATVSCTAFTPGSSGTNFQFGYSDNGTANTHKFSDLTVGDISSTSTPNFLMFLDRR